MNYADTEVKGPIVSPKTFPAFTVIILLCLFVAAGCVKGTVKVRQTLPEIMWPGPPEPPRIRFINSISNSEDMGIRHGAISSFFRSLVSKPEQPIITPYGVETDTEGRLYVVDTFLRKVHVYDLKKNRHSTFPEEGTTFVSPIDIAIDNKRGLIFITDSKEAVIKVFRTGSLSFLKEIGREMAERPTGIAINEKDDELLVVDTISANILRFDLNNHQFIGTTGRDGTGEGRLHYPTNITVSREGNIIISDSLNFRVQVFSHDWKFIRAFGEAGDSPGYFLRPKGVAADSDSNIYVVDAIFGNVQIFDSNGSLLLTFGRHGNRYGEFWLPSGIFIDGSDRIFVSDSYNKRVQVFQYLKNTKEADK